MSGQAVEDFTDDSRQKRKEKGDSIMLYTIIVALLVLWFLGFYLSVGGYLIHALLFIAAVVFLYNFLSRRGRWVF